MILNALQLVKEELKQYLEAHDDDYPDFNNVVLGNIAMLDNEDCGDVEDNVVISLVNIEEERTLKNGKSAYLGPANSVSYQNRPVHLNLYVLFSAFFCAGMMPYEISLRKLSLIIRFFQAKNVFTVQGADATPVLASIGQASNDNLRLIFDLYTMTFEQLNHLWGALGGKQVPSVMYMARLIEVKDVKQQGSGQLIEQIDSNEIIY